MEVDDAERRYTLDELLDATDQLDIPPAPAAIGVGRDGEPRLIIEKIVNTDFKSYAGTKVLGPFHKAFTSIIGESKHVLHNLNISQARMALASQM